MTRKNGELKIKIQFEEKPIFECKTQNLKDIDEIFQTIKKKLR